ncbi:MAG: hypothetical protein KatS3mg108_2963 [Isosphaeraceae bacterium]|nr:MAG: hypothetical protein KatS3mg108_2963 [Isosphaeraceae bacterium]
MKHWLILTGLVGFAGIVAADDFDRLEGEALKQAAASEELRLTLDQDELARLPRVFPGVRSTVLIARTNEGNLARLLVIPARRIGEDGREAPVLLIEQYATFASPGYRQRLARGRDVMLFDGWRFDLDSGQLVPDQFGGDLRLTVTADTRLRLEAEPGAGLIGLQRSPLNGQVQEGRPTPGPRVQAEDHQGRFRLIVAGRWSGPLELKVDGAGQVSGSFRSDQTGAVYRVRGEVVRGGTPRLDLTIDFPRSQMKLTGYLWPEGKHAIAGFAQLMEQEYGFVAVRAGRSPEPPGLEWEAEAIPPDGLVVRLAADGTLWREGQVVEPARLAEDLQAEPGRSIQVVADRSTPVGVLDRVSEQLRAAGFASVLLVVAEDGRDD